MPFKYLFLLSMSILLPIFAGIIRFRKISSIYHPFIYLLFIGILNEFASHWLNSKNQTTAFPTNIYFLIEGLILLWQFRIWKNILRNTTFFWLLFASFIAVWVYDYILLGNIVRFSLIYQLYYSLVIILLCITEINRIIINERNSIIRNPIFIICIGIILFFSYKIMAEVFYCYAPKITMKKNIFVYEAYMNVVYNILLFIAILCIPPKKIFTRQLQ